MSCRSATSVNTGGVAPREAPKRVTGRADRRGREGRTARYVSSYYVVNLCLLFSAPRLKPLRVVLLQVTLIEKPLVAGWQELRVAVSWRGLFWPGRHFRRARHPAVA